MYLLCLFVLCFLSCLLLFDAFVALGLLLCLYCFFFKQQTAYEMRIGDWSSDVCSSDLSGWSAVAIDLVAQCPGFRRGGLGVVVAAGRIQDRARGADQQASPVGGKAVLHHRGDIAALRTDARDQQWHVADDRAQLEQLFRPGRADDQRAVAEAGPVGGDRKSTRLK